MINTDLFDYYQQINAAHILMTFKGALSQNLLIAFGDLIKNQLHHDEKLQRVFGIFVEMTQNISHYSAEKEIGSEGKEVGVGLIVISEMNSKFLISSGNKVTAAGARHLAEQCNHLKTLDKDAMKKLYIARRKGETPEGSKGAGLGLIDIARKADEPIAYHIHPLDDTHLFFTLNITIHKTKKT